jgi:uncharacterized protein (TIRG00374 family)
MERATTPAGRRPPSASRARLAWAGRLALSGGLLAWLLSRSDMAHIARLMEGISPLLLLACFSVSLAATLVASLKWKLFLPSQSVGLLFRLNLVGLFYSMILPGQIAGEVVKAYRLGKGHRDAEIVVASVVLDRATGLIGLLMVGLIGAIWTQGLPDNRIGVALFGAFAVGMAGLYALRWGFIHAAADGVLADTTKAFPRTAPLCGKLRIFVEAWCSYLRQPALLIGAVAIAIGLQLIHVLIITFLSQPLGIHVSPLDWFWVFAVVSVAVVVPVSLGQVPFLLEIRERDALGFGGAVRSA